MTCFRFFFLKSCLTSPCGPTACWRNLLERSICMANSHSCLPLRLPLWVTQNLFDPSLTERQSHPLVIVSGVGLDGTVGIHRLWDLGLVKSGSATWELSKPFALPPSCPAAWHLLPPPVCLKALPPFCVVHSSHPWGEDLLPVGNSFPWPPVSPACMCFWLRHPCPSPLPSLIPSVYVVRRSLSLSFYKILFLLFYKEFLEVRDCVLSIFVVAVPCLVDILSKNVLNGCILQQKV